jgi:acetyltransferase-like isoleucine patch superfamily enzyme
MLERISPNTERAGVKTAACLVNSSPGKVESVRPMNGLLVKAALIAVVPSAALRRLLYRSVMGFTMPASSSVGILTLMAVPAAELGEGASIGPLNIFKGPFEVAIGAQTRIGHNNRFYSSWKILDSRFAERNYTPRLHSGHRALILNDHFFDIYGLLSIGDGTWIAGYGSQFWTHGLSVTDRDIVIGSENYLGSAVRFAPGTSIGDRNIIALGSVVLSKIEANDSLISGFPAKAIRSIAEDRAGGEYRFSFEDW